MLGLSLHPRSHWLAILFLVSLFAAFGLGIIWYGNGAITTETGVVTRFGTHGAGGRMGELVFVQMSDGGEQPMTAGERELLECGIGKPIRVIRQRGALRPVPLACQS